MLDDTPLPFGFPSVGRKKLTAAFDGGRITSDGGVLLLGVVEQHRHRLVASQGSSGGSEAAKAEPRPSQAFDPPVVLFSDVVQVLALPQPGPSPQFAGGLHVGNGLRGLM